MPLTEYKKKRSFNKTPEPTGGKPTDKKLHFVIQKHHASHLHYDFRLELRGILKSWAVPKGLSMDPKVKRLAMLVEDHPWDYRDFEGIIPSGYGKGTVIVWDEGTYATTTIKEKDKKAQEHSITSQFWKGEMKFTLQGHKVKGSFKMVRAKDKGDNAWYLWKLKDNYATTEDITTKDKSVLSKKTLEQVAANPDREWESHKPAHSKKSDVEVKEDVDILIKKGNKLSMPEAISPMLCTLVREPFTKEGWVYEVKWDGYRIIAFKNKKDVVLRSRSSLDYSERYTVIHDALKKLQGNFILDGELVALDENGKINFNAVQKANSGANLVYYVFDILWKDGYDLMNLPLSERKAILKEFLAEHDMIKYSESFYDGEELYKQAEKLELEGIVAKNAESIYQPGQRGNDWLKIPTVKRQEFVIGGWAESEKARFFRSLLFGAYNSKGEFEWIGRSGGGFKENEMPGILKKLKSLEMKESPFVNKILDTKGATIHYVKPRLVAHFKFATWTESGRIRKPATFLGFRTDKNSKDVVREVPLTEKQKESIIENETSNKKESKKTAQSSKTIEGSNWSELEKIEITSRDSIEIDGCNVELTNVEHELWKGITKADLITYYNSISDYLLPYIKNRPLSLHIKPSSATAPGLYIKDMEGRQPSCADIFSTKRKHPKTGKRNFIDYLVCNNKPTLLYLINLGCIDINPWTSTADDYLHPNFIVIDLDPSDDDFKKVITTAQASKQFFDEHKLKAFIKTSGKTGMHIFIPCKDFAFPHARAIAAKICSEVNQLAPNITTTTVSVNQRGNKLYIDPNQNDEADTVACAYSCRPFKVPTVSTPLEWKEVNSKLNPHNFTIKTIGKRIEKKGDLFKGLMNEKIRMANSKILKKFL